MNLKTLYRFLPFFILFFLPVNAEIPPDQISAYLENAVYITETHPPLNFRLNGTLQGITIETLSLIFKKMNLKKTTADVQLLPWARGYNLLKTTRNAVLFGMVKNKERETLFKFAGPVCSNDIAVYTLRSKKIQIHSIADLKKYNTGVIHDDIAHLYLLERGFSPRQMTVVPESATLALLLDQGRIDAWADSPFVIPWIARENGLDINRYEKVLTVTAGNIYFAFSKFTPDEVVAAFQRALNEVKKESEYRKIIKKYKSYTFDN